MASKFEPFPEYSEELPANIDTTAQRPVRKKNRLPLLLVLAAAIIILGAAGTGAYWIFFRHKPVVSTTVSKKSSVQASAPQPSPAASASGDTTVYTSNGQDLNLTFAYSSDWSSLPASGNNKNDQQITVTSPISPVTNSAGRNISGKVIVSIRPGNAQLSELASGSALVAQDSVQIGYTKPTASQHQYPYLTYIRLSGGNDPENGFDEVIITGISKFTKGQNMSPESLGQLDPIVTARFFTCTATCTTAESSALIITNNVWQTGDLFTKTLALFESLQLH